ncbi:ovarian cancer G-protein coupled receptor 1 isoform X2 [Tympanuchus pallidicinctus]|uniref:ovarian cancer G-protein coupled receptor 1 isoform X2 n=1 Tax=Tympanuchus pallidicinctus TaxID=109042 RepID=UPI0022870C38|nr:ovarian cancer G-protein coupled receptor 1 isoform X2 [Tympanuchus pallidicinctus]
MKHNLLLPPDSVSPTAVLPAGKRTASNSLSRSWEKGERNVCALHTAGKASLHNLCSQGGLWPSLGANFKLSQDDLWLARLSAAVPGRAAVTLVPSVEEGVILRFSYVLPPGY